MKIGVFAIPQISPGKYNIKDQRLEQVAKLAKSQKTTYIQVELLSEDAILESDTILTLSDTRTDLVLRDLEFIERRWERAVDPTEKALLEKLKNNLEKEEFVIQISLSAEERRQIAQYGLYTERPVILATKEELSDLSVLLARAIKESGFISFLTAREKEARAWLIKHGTTAWEAAGAVHSDIQKGFIRAEVISHADYIQCGGELPAKQAGKLRLEQKDYLMQDGEIVNFRFNK